MAATQDPPLDEIQWRSPESVMEMGGIHSNSVLYYFARSPYFDQTSNNAIVFSQSQFNPHMYHIIETREAFEHRLKTMSGLEYVVAQEPAEMAPGTGTGVWVISKQIRKKRTGMADEITPLDTYYVVGENIYMAASVGDVLQSRLLSIVSSLNSFIATAAALPNFTPALGQTYMPPPKAKSKGPDSQSQLTPSFNTVASQISKENTPMPDTTTKSTSHSQPTSYASARLLEESFNLTLRYGDEYMDTNPITGHPGDFLLKSTGRKDAFAQKEKDKLTVSGKGLNVTAPPTPDVKNSDLPPTRKGSRGDKSPRTPGGTKVKKRKSKISSAAATPS